jgi:hypothetical protein
LSCVIHQQVVAATRCAVAAFLAEFPAAKAAESRLIGQCPGRQVRLVVHTARADGQIRVAAEEVDDHFLPDAGDMNAAQLVARPRRADAQPAGAVLVLLANAIPGELNLDAAQLVSPQVLPFGADDQRGLRTTGLRFAARRYRAQGLVDRMGREGHMNAPLLLPVLNRVLVLAVLRDVLDDEVGVQNQVLGIGSLAGMLRQPEGTARHHAAQIAAALGTLAMCAQGLHAQQGQLSPFVVGIIGLGDAGERLGVVAACMGRMPLVDLAVGQPCGPRGLAVHAQVGPRSRVVVVPGAVLAAREMAARNEAADVFGIGFPAGHVVLDLAVCGTVGLFVGAHGIREDQPVFVLGRLEVVADSPFFAQAAEEVEIGLVVLRLEFALGVCLEQALFDGEGIVGQQLFEDLDDALVLEDLAVGRESGPMQPGTQRELVLDVPAFFAPHGGIGDQGVDLAHAGADLARASTGDSGKQCARAVELDPATDLAADERIEIEIGRAARGNVQRIGGLQQQFVFEEAVDALSARQANRRQRRLAQHKGNRGRLNSESSQHGPLTGW